MRREPRKFMDERPRVTWEACTRCGYETERRYGPSPREALLGIQQRAAADGVVMNIQGIDYGPGIGTSIPHTSDCNLCRGTTIAPTANLGPGEVQTKPEHYCTCEAGQRRKRAVLG